MCLPYCVVVTKGRRHDDYCVLVPGTTVTGTDTRLLTLHVV